MRLLNRHRERIADALTARKFDPLQKVEKERQTDLAKRIYRTFVSEDVEKKADALEKLCPGIITHDKDISIHTDEAGGRAIAIDLGFSRPSPTAYLKLHPKAGEPFYEEITEVVTRHHALMAERSAAHSQAWAALDKFHTFEKLEAAWPDVMPVAREACADMPKPIANLPAVAVEDLNAMFDLPPEALAA